MSLAEEIREQPQVLARLLDRQRGAVHEIARSLAGRSIDTVFIAARGTSDNAAVYAKYVWGTFNRVPVVLAAPSLFSAYGKPPRLRNAIVVGVSQSGQSPDIVGVLEEARRQGAPSLAIVNEPESPLAKAADAVIDIGAGPETAVAATKSYTAQLAAIAMLSAAVGGDDERWGELRRVPELVAKALELDSVIAERAERYRFMAHCVVLGRGFNYATAFEWALKLKELTYVIAEPYSSADFQHGPVAMVERGFPVLAVAPGGAVFDDARSLLARLVEEKQVELLVVSDRDEALALAHTPLRLPPGETEWLTPLVAIVPAQLFCYHLTRAKGFDTEAPRGLRKVTLTR